MKIYLDNKDLFEFNIKKNSTPGKNKVSSYLDRNKKNVCILKLQLKMSIIIIYNAFVCAILKFAFTILISSWW